MYRLLVKFALLGAVLIGGSNAEALPETGSWNLTEVDLLRRTLLSAYDPNARPSPYTVPTPVTLGLKIYSASINEKHSAAVINGWLKMKWYDPKLRWTPSNAGNIQALHMMNTEIWKPDITLYNSNAREVHLKDTNAIVFWEGGVIWVPPFRYEAVCDLNYKYWPRDTHQCEFVFGSWTYHAFAINLTLDGNGIDITDASNQDQKGQWMVKSIQAELQTKIYECCTEPYPSVHFRVTIARKGTIYAIINEVSALSLTILLLSSVFRPPDSRLVLLSVVVCLSFLYLLICTIKLPCFSDSPPRICLYYTGILSVSVIWCFSAMLLEYFEKYGQRFRPKSLLIFVRRPKLDVNGDNELNAIEGQRVTHSTQGTNTDTLQQWTNVTMVVDKIVLMMGVMCLAGIIILTL